MKRDSNTLVKRYSGVLLPRDGEALLSELAACLGTRTTLRVRQGESRWDLRDTEVDPVGTLRAAGRRADEPCAVELLTRDPQTMLPDPDGRHRDRNDQRALMEARLRRLPGRGGRGARRCFSARTGRRWIWWTCTRGARARSSWC